MNDSAFGLLEPAESARVAAHLRECAACQGVAADAERFARLSQAASSADFPVTLFTPPAVPRSPTPVRTPLAAAFNWAIAASLLLGVAGLVPAAIDARNVRHIERELQQAQAEWDTAQARVESLDADVRSESEAIRARRAEAALALDQLASDWVSAEVAATPVLTATGPASAVAGAPNPYAWPLSGPAQVVVSDARGATRFREPLDGRGRVELPASIWTADSPPTTVRVEVAGQTVYSRPLMTPVYTTHLMSDRTVYRPGETVYARALTLDREKLHPPSGDYPVWFDLTGPRGIVPESGQLAQSSPADARSRAVVGPDGKPVRGVATAAIVLPPDLREGSYELRVVAAEQGVGPRPGAVPVSIPLTVSRGRPPAFDRVVRFDATTFGPGDGVSGTLTLTRAGRPLSRARVTLNADATVGGKPQSLARKRELTVGADGVAAFRLTLPQGDVTAAEVTLTATVDGATEWVKQPVPVRSSAVWVELFPEGGEWIGGVPGRVYWRATGADGRPATLQGGLQCNGREVARLAGVGRGVVDLTPQLGVNYTVQLEGDARVAALSVPKVAASGVGLRVDSVATSAGEPLRLTLTSAGAARSVVVGAYRRGLPLGHAKLALKSGEPTPLTLDLGSNAVGGVVRVTVFEETLGRDLKPVAERLVFRRPARSLSLSAKPTASGVQPGGRVRLELASRTEAGEPIGAVLLAAVAVESQSSPASLPGYFLLGHHLDRPESVESAEFVLSDAPGASAALDTLLATQGWRRFAEQSPAGGALPTRLAGLGASPFTERAQALEAVQAQAWAARLPGELVSERGIAGRSALSLAGRIMSGRAQLTEARAAWATRSAWWPCAVTAAFAVGFSLLGLIRCLRGNRSLVLVAVGFLLVGLGGGISGWAARSSTEAVLVPVAAPNVPAVPNAEPLPSADAALLALLTPEPRDPSHLKSLVVDKGERAGFWRPSPPQAARIESFAPRLPRRAPGVKSATERLFGEGAVLRPDVSLLLPARLARETAPERVAAARRIAARLRLPVTQVVREYANMNPAGPQSVPPPETLLWKPCLVSDAQGHATVEFDVPAAAANYRVVVAGHTPDGRIGTATSRVAVGAK